MKNQVINDEGRNEINSMRDVNNKFVKSVVLREKEKYEKDYVRSKKIKNRTYLSRTRRYNQDICCDEVLVEIEFEDGSKTKIWEAWD